MKRFGRYHIDKRILSHLSGEDFKAQDGDTGAWVRLSMLSVNKTRYRRLIRRLIRGAKLSKAIDHPNILPVTRVGKRDDDFFIVSDYIRTQNLDVYIKKKRQLTIERTLHFACQIASAMKAAHQAGLCHMALRAEVILMDNMRRLYLTQFAPIKPDDGEDHSEKTEKMYRYMSPERSRGYQPDERSDVYAFGTLMYQMLTGVVPFVNGQGEFSVQDLQQKEPLPLHIYVDDLSDEFQALIMRCLRKEPEQRFQTFEAILSILELLKEAIDEGAANEKAGQTAFDAEFESVIAGVELDEDEMELINSADNSQGISDEEFNKAVNSVELDDDEIQIANRTSQDPDIVEPGEDTDEFDIEKYLSS